MLSELLNRPTFWTALMFFLSICVFVYNANRNKKTDDKEENASISEAIKCKVDIETCNEYRKRTDQFKERIGNEISDISERVDVEIDDVEIGVDNQLQKLEEKMDCQYKELNNKIDGHYDHMEKKHEGNKKDIVKIQKCLIFLVEKAGGNSTDMGLME